MVVWFLLGSKSSSARVSIIPAGSITEQGKVLISQDLGSRQIGANNLALFSVIFSELLERLLNFSPIFGIFWVVLLLDRHGDFVHTKWTSACQGQAFFLVLSLVSKCYACKIRQVNHIVSICVIPCVILAYVEEVTYTFVTKVWSLACQMVPSLSSNESVVQFSNLTLKGLDGGQEVSTLKSKDSSRWVDFNQSASTIITTFPYLPLWYRNGRGRL